VRILQGGIRDASALKMSYGGITKGMIAVVTTMVLAADRAGLASALERELAESEPMLRESFGRRIPDMNKAYRWVDEMRQIRDFAQADPAAASIYAGAAELHTRIAADVSGPRQESDALLIFFKA
jgi:3-hydroxyisobutyrate dehydrogenase-like beta-hydroxyacid dehydrogenase